MKIRIKSFKDLDIKKKKGIVHKWCLNILYKFSKYRNGVRGKTSDFARHYSMNAHLISLKLKYVVNENNFVCVGKY